VIDDDDIFVRGLTVSDSGNIGTLEIWEKLIQSPEINIYDSDIFSLARTLAVRFSKEKTPFIPVYPELIGERATGIKARKPENRKARKRQRTAN